MSELTDLVESPWETADSTENSKHQHPTIPSAALDTSTPNPNPTPLKPNTPVLQTMGTGITSNTAQPSSMTQTKPPQALSILLPHNQPGLKELIPPPKTTTLVQWVGKEMKNNNNTYLRKTSCWQTKIKQVVAQCHPPYNAKLKLVYMIKYFHLLTSSQWWSMQWNSPLVHNGIPKGTINSSHSSIRNQVSCLNDWLLFANAINYSRLPQLIALRNLTNLSVE